MDGHLRLSAKERKTCLSTYRAARQARRALILLLLAEGRSYREIAAAALASPTMIRAVKKDWDSFTCAKCPMFHQDRAPGADTYAFNQPADPGRP